MRVATVIYARILLRRLLRNEQLIVSLLGLAVGVAAGFAAVAFRAGIAAFQRLGFGFTSEFVITGLAGLAWWRVVLTPALGGLLIGLFLHLAIKGGRTHGIAEVIEASALGRARMAWKDSLVSAVGSAASLGFGASAGREGPAVHLGASLGAWLAARLKLGPSLSRTLLGCGVASAVAASFNTPIAGVFFALEVTIGHHAVKAFVPIVLASVAGTAIGRVFYGDTPAFIVPPATIASLWELPAFALLGVVGAAVAIAFMAAIFAAERLARRLPGPVWARPAVAGLALGVTALVLPHILGVGYEATDAALRAEYGLGHLLALIVAKIAATALSIGFGFGGGVFSPALFLGAMTGSAFGIVAGALFPALYSGALPYALIGTGAVAGAVLGAPMSTILIIFELSGDYAITLAVMIATAIATALTHQVYARSYFHKLLASRGVALSGGHAQNVLREMRVAGTMRRDHSTLAPDASLDAVLASLQTAPAGEVHLVERDGRLSGVVSYTALDDSVFRRAREEDIRAADIAHWPAAVLSADDTLEQALDVMRSSGEEHIPVVEDSHTLRLIGVIHERDVAHAYNRALLAARAEEHDRV